MRAAASIPLDQDNDYEALVAADRCKTAAEWGAAFLRYPKVSGIAIPTEKDAVMALEGICAVNRSGIAACDDARSLGWFVGTAR
jgi:hypothetical protein